MPSTTAPSRRGFPGDSVPKEFVEAADDPGWIVAAHGDHFETAIERHVLQPLGWPPHSARASPLHDVDVVGARAAARLAAVADALELANRKDTAGERLMHQMSKPRRARQGEDSADVHWFDDADRRQRLYDYCRQDVEVERELYNRPTSVIDFGPTLWVLSSQINERGFHVDRQFAEAARRIAQAAAPEIDAELAELTAGAVTGINQVARLLQWLQNQGCIVQTLGRKAIENLLEQAELPPVVQRALELRLGGAQAATKKSIACSPALVPTTACAAHSGITAPPPAAGLAKVSSRKT